jgi:hypothetical protein
MATQDDITIVNDEAELQFQCRACNTRFKVLPRVAADRQREGGTLDQVVRQIVAEHIRGCRAGQSERPKKK